MMADLYDNISDPERPRIRLLTLLRPGLQDDGIRCHLNTYDISDVPPYDSLSYVWGDASDRKLIECNGQPLGVTSNLFKALQGLRLRDEDLVLWVDAVCIDQSNLAERSSQIQFMSNIYGNSSRTLIWLGEPDAASDIVLSLCFNLLEDEQQWPPIFRSPGIIEALLSFFERPWWVRCWIIQEFLLSPSPVLIINGAEVAWEVIQRIIFRIADEVAEAGPKGADVPFVATMYRLAQCEGFVAASALHKKKLSNSAVVELLDLLLEFRNFRATDPRDKVYALLGMVTGTHVGIYPDYTVSTMECYTSAAFAILESSRDLRLLDALVVFERNRDLGLPSWVPQWDSESRAEMDPGQRLPSLLQSVKSASQGARAEPLYNASLHRQFTHLGRIGPNVLVLDGLVMDKIVDLSDALFFPVSYHSQLAASGLSVDNPDYPDFVKSGIIQMGQQCDTLTTWRRLGIHDVPSQQYPTGETHLIAFLYTTNGPEDDLVQASEELQDAIHLHDSPNSHLSTIMGAALDTTSTTSRHMFQGLLQLNAGAAKASAGVSLPHCWDKRLARTANGYLGLLPSSAQVGDSLALLPGASTPVVIRASGDSQWSLIGSCYVHGLMHGEAWDESRVERLQFI